MKSGFPQTLASRAVPPRRRPLLLAGAALLAASVSLAALAAPDTVRIVTEQNPPANYAENGKLTGFCTEVVEAVLLEIGVRGSFEVMPWARAYATALRAENVLIYSIIRTPEREAQFKWVGVVGPNDASYLFSLRGRGIKLDTLDDAKRYRIGTVNDDVREQYLTSKGFVKGTNLQGSAKSEVPYEKLKLGRVDLWAMSELVATNLVRRAGDDPDKVLERVYRLADLGNDGSYMAFGTKTPDRMVERFRQGLEAVKKSGKFEALKKKWF